MKISAIALLTLSLLSVGVPTAGLVTAAQAAGCTRVACPPDIPNDHDDDDTPTIIKQDLMLISCRVWGEPVAMPDDLKFRNIGDLTIPAGTRVYWMIKESGDHGYFSVPVDLQPGDVVFDRDVLKHGLPTDVHCYSKIM